MYKIARDITYEDQEGLPFQRSLVGLQEIHPEEGTRLGILVRGLQLQQLVQ